MNVLVDTNIFLDVLLERSAFLSESQKVLSWCESHPGSGWIAWHSLSNLAFIGKKMVGPRKTTLALEQILDCFQVAPVDTREAKQALSFGFSDFEDAMQGASAVSADAKWILTRNVSDFKHSPVPALKPGPFLKKVETWG